MITQELKLITSFDKLYPIAKQLPVRHLVLDIVLEDTKHHSQEIRRIDMLQPCIILDHNQLLAQVTLQHLVVLRTDVVLYR